MNAEELAAAVDELDLKLERLRVLYDQYFTGIEKIPPFVLQKDVDRRIWILRREKIRNTGTRFRFQQIIQRYNTFSSYWHRILREIENGTYKRDVLRAKKRFGVDPSKPREIARASTVPPRPATDLDELELDSVDLEDLGLDELDELRPRPAPPPAVRPPAPPSRAAVLPAAPSPAAVSPAAPSPAAAASPLGAKPLPPRAPSPPGPFERRDERPHASAPKRAAGDDDLDSMLDQALGVSARPSSPDPLPAARPSSPNPLPAARPSSPNPLPAARPSSPNPLPAARPSSPDPIPIATTTRNESAPRPPTQIGPRPGAVQTAPRPAVQAPQRPAPTATASKPATGDDYRRIYAQYVETKRRNGESTAGITYENLAKSLRETTEKLKSKSGGKSIDFEVAVKDGKTVLKPVVR